MKRIFNITLIVVAGLILMFTSCKNVNFGDLNQPEHAITKTTPSALLAGATVSYGAIAGRLYSTNYSFYIQWLTQGVYDDEQRYANFQGAWAAYYVGPLANIQAALNMMKDTAYANSQEFTDVNGAAQNVYAYALVLKSIIFKRITDIFGAIPMSEALDTSNITPAYDTQQQVYQQLIDMLKTARDTLDEGKPGCKGDVFYGGDVAKLKKLANSLLLEVALQISEVDPALAQSTFEDAANNAAGLILDPADEAWYYFDEMAGIYNPWSRLRYSDYYFSLQFQKSLEGDTTTLDALGNRANVTSNINTDYRVYFYIDYYGYWHGMEGYDGEDYFSFSPDQDFLQPWQELFSNPALPLPELTAAYTWLNLAEGAARGWNTGGITTDQALQNGIIASYNSFNLHWGVVEKVMSMYGVDESTYQTLAQIYATARVNDLASVDPLQVIGEEKWVALFPIPWKGWAEWRRTHYPALNPAPAAQTFNGGRIPTRYRYPAEEINLNNEHYLQGVQDLHDPQEDQNYAHVWWDPHTN